jgi:hypothetical protein
MTKLAAATCHALMAAAFFKQQVLGDTSFNELLWIVYGSFAIAHAAYDKTTAVVKDFKDKKLAAEHPSDSTVSRTETVSTTTAPAN